tara:strand:- start:187 stop:360 length:174 start_codon:yes stop_codon:yes gene_type:complete
LAYPETEAAEYMGEDAPSANPSLQLEISYIIKLLKEITTYQLRFQNQSLDLYKPEQD